MSDEFVENLKQPSAWLRVLFMAGFVLALYVSGVILLVLMLAQILFSLITGSDNTNLRRLGSSLTLYVSHILEFLTYNREDKPFPFAPFPLAADEEIDDVTTADTGTAARTSASQQQQPAAQPAPATDAETAAESAARVMAESAARRATRSTSKTPKASAGTASTAAQKSAAAKKSTAGKSTTRKPAEQKATAKKTAAKTVNAKSGTDDAMDAGPEMGVTDVVDRQAKDV